MLALSWSWRSTSSTFLSSFNCRTLSSVVKKSSPVSDSKELARVKAQEEAIKLREALQAEKSPIQKYVEKTRDISPHMVWGSLTEWKDPELPQVVSEVSALDPAHTNQDPPSLATGEKRMVVIRQEHARPSQAPTDIENQWVISFQDDGELSQCWENSLMGWVSSSDPMANNMRLQMSFRNASDAVYFAKKRGWDYVVAEPIVRYARNDGAQYQDNFLPQDIAAKIRRERKKCKQWERSASGTSHYQRPLTYDGKALARQHGPNQNEPVAQYVPGYYKVR